MLGVLVGLYRIIHIIPYKSLFPPFGGGALRCFHLLREMARYHEIHLILHQSKDTLQGVVNGYKFPDSVHIYSTNDDPPSRSIFHKLPKRIGPGLHYRWLCRNWRGPAEGTLLRCHSLLEKIIQNHLIDCVVFEHLSSMTLSVLVRRWQPKIRCVLDAHNVDHKLMEQVFISYNQNKRLKSRILKRLCWTESHLGKFVNSFWACSNEDKSYLESLNSINGYVIPNGVDTDYFLFDLNEKKYEQTSLIFAASFDTAANLDGLNYLVDEIWPLIHKNRPKLRLLLVGKGISSNIQTKSSSTPSIDMFADVPDVRSFYKKAAISLVPLRIGSGTRLKILEGMSQGIPIISTTRGAEGINATHGEHLFLADSPSEFSKYAMQLLSNHELYQRLRHNARRFVEKKFDWRIIGDSINKSLLEVMRTDN